jgi:hypothetical protein
MFQEYNPFANKNQRPPEIGTPNDNMRLMTTYSDSRAAEKVQLDPVRHVMTMLKI